jgi:hypothetical protein|tara:strand:+ start:279 stop:1754 length:1476 start_codon:yes stop_codon:yes gene_type:complete
MADKVVLEAEIKSNIKAVSQDTKELTNNFGAFGITIGGIKDKFKDVAKIMNNGLKQVILQAKLAGVGFKKMFSGEIIGGAKTLFRVIATGVKATGIGALVIAFTALATWFTKTKVGAELLQRIFKSMGAAVNVVVGRVAQFGRGLKDLVTGGGFAALQKLMGTFSGMGEEIKNDITQTFELTKAQQKLVDSERDLRVETSQRRAEIEKLKMIAEDLSKSEKERLIAAQEAFDIENDLLDRRIGNAQKSLSLHRQQMSLREIDGKNTEADLEKEAELRIAIADITAESTTKQIELNNKLNSIRAEMNKETEQQGEDMKMMPRLAGKEAKGIIKADNSALDNYLANNKKRKESAEANKEAVTAAASSLAGSLSSLAGDNKELAAAGALIDTYAGANKAFAQGGIAGFATGAAIIAAGLVNLQKIYATDVPGSGGGGGGGAGAAAAQAPAPQMMSGAFTLGGGSAPPPLQAFVVTDEMTNSQNQLANIRRRSTL